MQYISTALSLCPVSRHTVVFKWKIHCILCGSADSAKHPFYRKTTDLLFNGNGNAKYVSEQQFNPENVITQGKRESDEEADCTGSQDF